MTASGNGQQQQQDTTDHLHSTGASKILTMTSPVVNESSGSSATASMTNNNPISSVSCNPTNLTSSNVNEPARKSAHRLLSRFFSNFFCCCFRTKNEDGSRGRKRKQSKKLLNASGGGAANSATFGDNNCYGDSFYAAAAGHRVCTLVGHVQLD